MFGLPEALMSFIRRQVGLRTDEASATGSVHAKLAYIADTTMRPRGLIKGSRILRYPDLEETWCTALDIVGKGKLLLLRVDVDLGDHMKSKVTLDGGIPMLVEGGTSDGNKYYVDSQLYFGDSSSARWLLPSTNRPDTTGIPVTLLNMPFKESLKIEVYGKNASGSLNTIFRWAYEIE